MGGRLAYSLGYRSQLKATEFSAALPSEGTEIDKEAKELLRATLDETLNPDKPLIGITNARLRLENHITSLRNASILNLFVGTFIAISGIYVLSTVFVDIDKFGVLSEKKIGAGDFLVFSLLPRVSATLFIQIFAYFFLLMYRSNQADIRYFQNEMSNLDAIATGVALALRADVSTTQKTVIGALLKTERNRVMSKGQRVINPAEDSELHQKVINEMSQAVAKLSAQSKNEKK
jgi:hypothetical protein